MALGLIGGITSALGGIIGNKLSAQSQYEYQSKLQQQQQNWLTEMSNTAHQREMNDLREAGLNPLLTVTGGNGASTPSSGMGNVGLTDDGAKIQQGITTALQFRQQKNQDKQTQAQVKNLNAQTDTEATKQRLNLADEMLKKSQTILNDKEASVYMKRFAKQMQLVGSEIFLNQANATANQQNAESNKLNAQTASAKEKRENILTAVEQAENINKIEHMKNHPIQTYGDNVRKRLKNALFTRNENRYY